MAEVANEVERLDVGRAHKGHLDRDLVASQLKRFGGDLHFLEAIVHPEVVDMVAVKRNAVDAVVVQLGTFACQINRHFGELVGQELFGYYECEKGIEFAARVQNESPVVARWNEYMKDVMVMEADPETGAQPKLSCVFTFDGEK